MREDDFEVYLRNTNLSENTIASYKFAVKQYFGQFDTVTQKKLRDHKMWLIESYKPKTVNLRRHQLLPGQHWKGSVEAAVCKGAAEGLSGECDQRGGL